MTLTHLSVKVLCNSDAMACPYVCGDSPRVLT